MNELSKRRARPLVPLLSIPLLLACSDAGIEPQSLEGVLQPYVADYESGEHRLGYTLKTSDGKYVELEFSSPPLIQAGDRIRVHGAVPRARDPYAAAAAKSELIAVESFEVIGPPKQGTLVQPFSNGSPTTVNVAIVLLDFSGVPPQSFTPNDAQERLDTVHAYYDELSFGMWDVQGDVFGPFTVGTPTDCNMGTIVGLARTAASSSGVNLNAYDHIAVTLPSNNDSGLNCFCGAANLGRTPAQGELRIGEDSLYTCTDPNAFAHELGHAFGLQHARTANCNGVPYRRNVYDTCSIIDYGNQFNTMGNGLGHMNAFQKATMNWFDECNHMMVTKDGTFEIEPIQVPSGAVQSLQIPTGDVHNSNELFYYVEYRNPDLATFNAGGSNPREQGPGVHITVGQDYRRAYGEIGTLLLDMSPTSIGSYDDPRLTVGRSFSDPDSRVTIEVLDLLPSKATIQVTFPGGGSGDNVCADSAPPNDPPAVLFEHCWHGGWAVALEPGDYTTADLEALGVLNNEVSSIIVAEGYEADLFDGDNFTGNSITVTGDTECLVHNNFNDALSSLRLRVTGPGLCGNGVCEANETCESCSEDCGPCSSSCVPQGCESAAPITLPYVVDGASNTCVFFEGHASHANSWNMDLVEINGVDFTNGWVSSSSFPALCDNGYYVRSVSSVPWAHLEVN